MPHPDLTHCPKPLALAIDIGSSSVRAVLFDARGHQIPHTEHRERYKLQITPDGGGMCDPHRIRQLTARCMQKTCAKVEAHIQDIAVVGISCHWHSLMGLDQQGDPLTPVYMWSDKRSSSDADALQIQLADKNTHARTGCRLHSSYWPAKLKWLNRTRQEVVSRINTWCGLPDWLVLADGEPIRSSISMASGTGLFDASQLGWDESLTSLLEIAHQSLPTIVNRWVAYEAEAIHPDLRIAGLNAIWFPALGDGAAANIGAGAVGSDRIALTIGTSGAIRLAREINLHTPLPSGLFRYLIDDQTEVIGGALSNGGNMIAWLANLTQMKDRTVLMKAAAKIDPDSHGLTLLPFFAGERAPSWQDQLGGTITGMSLDTTSIHILRAMMEATAHRFASVYDDLRSFADDHHAIIANGGALLQSPLWSQITADALGNPISALQTRAEASARGAAISALNAAGHLDSLRTNAELGRIYQPNHDVHMIYKNARVRMESLEIAFNTWENANS